MRLRPDPGYEAAFVRAVNHDTPTPEELAGLSARRARRRMQLIVAGAVLLVGGIVGGAILIRRDTPAKQVERGEALAATNSHVAAIIEFKRSLQEEPNQPAVRVLLGKELSLMGDAKGAEIEFRKAADANYRPEQVLPLLATSLLHQGKFDKVIALVNDAKIDSPEGNAELLSLRGSSYYALGQESEAENSWKAANEFTPGNPETVLAQARARAAKGDFAAAAKVLDDIAPNAPRTELLSLRGEIARATGKPLDAVAIYQEALKGEPGNLFLRENLAEVFVELRRFDEAADQVKRVLLPMPNNANAHFVKALIAIGRNDMAAADESAGLAVQLAPTDGRFQLLAGMIALQLGRRPEAQQHLRDAVALLPQNVDARRMLAEIYIDKHDADRADDVFRPVFATYPKDPDNARVAARIAALRGNAAGAARAFDQIDPSNPKLVDANLLGASLQMAAGDRASGFARLHAAAEASPNDPEIDAALVKANLTFSDVKGAQAAWDGLAKKQPTAARTFNLQAGIDVARGDRVAARRSLQQAVVADPHYLAPVSGLAMLDLRDKKPDDAQQHLRTFIAANPNDVEAILLLVQLEKAAGNRSDAIVATLRDALKANPRSAPILYALVNQYAERGDLKRATEIAEQGLALAPNDVNLVQFVGDRALATGNNERAIALFTQLVDANAASADYPMRLGLAQLATGNPEEALTAFRLALSRDPNNQDRQLAMVGSFLGAGKPNEASRILFEITRLSPKSPVIPELDADVKLGLKQYPEANAAYRRALALTPTPRLVMKTYNGLTTALLRGEANAFLADWLKSHPSDEAVRRFDGEVAMRSKDFVRAGNDFRILAVAHPNDPKILNNLAWNLSQVNDPQALTIAEKAGALAPDDPSISDTLGWMLVENGDAGRGLALIEKASLAAPNALDIRLHLGKAQLKEGRRDAARATLEGLVATAPTSEQGRASRALLATF